MRVLLRHCRTTIGIVLSAAGLLLSCLPSAAARPHHHNSTHAMVHHVSVAHSVHTEHAYSFLTMSSERATEIQTALIGKGYLSGEPTGTWDAASMNAMQRLQGDNGWQTKLVPDSRALIKLGLGPGSAPSTASSTVTGTTAAATVEDAQTN